MYTLGQPGLGLEASDMNHEPQCVRLLPLPGRRGTGAVLAARRLKFEQDRPPAGRGMRMSVGDRGPAGAEAVTGVKFQVRFQVLAASELSRGRIIALSG